jgi:hypothetical protein
VKAEAGDKVRLKAGTHAGERGFLDAFDELYFQGDRACHAARLSSLSAAA